MHRLDQCRTLNRCSNRGVCVMGSCQCNAGWGGPDCTDQLREETWPPSWLTYIIMLSCVLVSIVAWLGARHFLQEYVEQRRRAAEEHATLMVRCRPSQTCQGAKQPLWPFVCQAGWRAVLRTGCRHRPTQDRKPMF